MSKQSGGGVLFIGLIIIIGFATVIFLMPKGEAVDTNNPVDRIFQIFMGGDGADDEGLLSSPRDVISCEISLLNQVGSPTKITNHICRVEENICTDTIATQMGLPFVDIPKTGDKGYIMMIIGDKEKKVIEYDMTETWSAANEQTFSAEGFCYKPERLDRYEITLKNFDNKDQFVNQKETFAEAGIR